MNVRYVFAVILLLALLAAVGCDNDSTVTPAPPSQTALTLDEQVIANCEVLRDSLEAYASRHNGDYPDGTYYRSALNVHLTNPYTGMPEESGPRARFRGQTAFEPYMACDGSNLIAGYRITGYGLDHQLIQFESVEQVPADSRWVHDIVVANAYLVLDAAQRWAETNGHYPSDLSDTGSGGKTLIDLLPGGNFLPNPIYGANYYEPIDGAPADVGDVGYTPIGSADGETINCLVEAYGCNFADGLTIMPDADYDFDIRTHSHELRAAVEEFASDAGTYPRDVDTDQTPSGKTVLDLLGPLGDPFTLQPSPPINGTATTRGQVGYALVIENDVVTGYVITARGLFDEIARLGPLP
jgi:hypothetical protein